MDVVHAHPGGLRLPGLPALVPAQRPAYAAAPAAPGSGQAV